MKIKTLNQAIENSLKAKQSKEYNTDLKITVDNETWQAYTISIANRDLLFYCNEGTATYLVDSYGDRHLAVLHDWEKEGE